MLSFDFRLTLFTGFVISIIPFLQNSASSNTCHKHFDSVISLRSYLSCAVLIIIIYIPLLFTVSVSENHSSIIKNSRIRCLLTSHYHTLKTSPNYSTVLCYRDEYIFSIQKETVRGKKLGAVTFRQLFNRRLSGL